MSLTTRWALGDSAAPSPWCGATANQRRIKKRRRWNRLCEAVFLCWKNEKRIRRKWDAVITIGHIFSSDLCFSCTGENIVLQLMVSHLFSGQTVESLAKTSSGQYHLSQNLMLHFRLRHNTSLQCCPTVILGSPVKMCLCDISFSKHSITAKMIHPLDMSHTQTKLYLLLNHISDGAALLENCMLCVWFMSQHI